MLAIPDSQCRLLVINIWWMLKFAILQAEDFDLYKYISAKEQLCLLYELTGKTTVWAIQHWSYNTFSRRQNSRPAYIYFISSWLAESRSRAVTRRWWWGSLAAFISAIAGCVQIVVRIFLTKQEGQKSKNRLHYSTVIHVVIMIIEVAWSQTDLSILINRVFNLTLRIIFLPRPVRGSVSKQRGSFVPLQAVCLQFETVSDSSVDRGVHWERYHSLARTLSEWWRVRQGSGGTATQLTSTLLYYFQTVRLLTEDGTWIRLV